MLRTVTDANGEEHHVNLLIDVPGEKKDCRGMPFPLRACSGPQSAEC